jgi:drug/metabolite transporter (DMT)-like permease
MTVLLALTSAILIGAVDFLGGAASRHAPSVRVAALAQLAGVAPAVVVAVLVAWEDVRAVDVVWSTLAGAVVAVGLWLFYEAMARDMISVVAPLAAVTGAALPVVFGFARGDRPGTLVGGGIVCAIASIAAVSLVPGGSRLGRAAVVMSVAAGVLFGLFYIALDQVDDDAGLWPVALLRVGALPVLVAAALTTTRGLSISRAPALAVLAMGALEVGGSATLLLALQGGQLPVVSVLASLYPVTTVLLAAGVLGERMSRLQLAAVVLALVAVVLISLG